MDLVRMVTSLLAQLATPTGCHVTYAFDVDKGVVHVEKIINTNEPSSAIVKVLSVHVVYIKREMS